MMILVYQIPQSLKMFSNTEASFKELDIFPSLCWSRDGVVISKHRTAWKHFYISAFQENERASIRQYLGLVIIQTKPCCQYYWLVVGGRWHGIPILSIWSSKVQSPATPKE